MSSQSPRPQKRYWKIFAGTGGALWDEWKKHGIAAMGWSDLGDLAGLDYRAFVERVKEHGYKPAEVKQLWEFRSIQTGDRIIATAGNRKAFDIGTVKESYQFIKDEEEFSHQIQVRWDDIGSFEIQPYGWTKPFLELNEDQFNWLLSAKGDVLKSKAKAQSPILPCNPQNIILYGPPGTGKTYNTRKRSLELILGEEGKDEIENLSESGLSRLFSEYQDRRQIEFVTFHQSYGYEEFIEGLRPILNDDDESEDDIYYKLHDGVFKRIAISAAGEGLKFEKMIKGDFEYLWNQLLNRIQEEDVVIRSKADRANKNYVLRVTRRYNITAALCETDQNENIKDLNQTPLSASQKNSKMIWENRNKFKEKPDNLTYAESFSILGRGHHFSALWIVYNELHELNEKITDMSNETQENELDPQDDLRARRTKQALSNNNMLFSFSAKSAQYVLIIDEINRGNISKILGELITLLEPDKRLGAENELRLPLVYSPDVHFGVPPNLHIIGTMNTADRSIALMDVALRRRFTFEELMPDVETLNAILHKKLLNTENNEINDFLVKLTVLLLDVMNKRIRFIYDRDHQIGHSYFLKVDSLNGDGSNSLRRVFLNQVIPLLQEYFYGDWDKICMILGCPYNEKGRPRLEDTNKYDYPIIKASRFSARGHTWIKSRGIRISDSL